MSTTPAAQHCRSRIVFLLHGLGAHPIVMVPLQLFLHQNGFPRALPIKYNVNTNDINTSVASASAAMLGALKARTPQEACNTWDVFAVGHSWGGLVCNRLHMFGWTIQGAVYVASPLHGARILSSISFFLPQVLHDMLARPAYTPLQVKEREKEPPHPYRTISCGYAKTSFDGAVFRDEAMLHPKFHTHLDWEDHSLILAKPRMWRVVAAQLIQMQRHKQVSFALQVMFSPILRSSKKGKSDVVCSM